MRNQRAISCDGGCQLIESAIPRRSARSRAAASRYPLPTTSNMRRPAAPASSIGNNVQGQHRILLLDQAARPQDPRNAVSGVPKGSTDQG